MDHYKETFNTWNKIAALYQDKFMDLDLYNETYDLFCAAIAKHKAKVLDIGCGPGNITRYLLAKRPDLQIAGIDIAPNMVALAQQNNPSASFSVLDSRNIDTLHTKFDGIICGFCLPYLSESDSQKLIADAFDILTDQGLFYLSFVEGDPATSDFKVGSSGDRVYFYYHDLENLSRQLMDAGFERPKLFRVNYTSTDLHTILIIRKNPTVS